MKIKNIPVNLIDIAEENVRKNFPFGQGANDNLIKTHLSKFDLLQPVVVRFDKESKRYKLLIGRRRFLALSDKGEKEISAVITELEGAEAEAASLFENLIRKDLSSIEKAMMVKKLVDSTKSGISGVSKKYGLPKSTVSEWLSILTLSKEIRERIEKGEITSYEAIAIARKPKSFQDTLTKVTTREKLDEEMIRLGVKRGAPKGLLTVRLVFNPLKRKEKDIWDILNKEAKENGLEITDYVKIILANHIKHNN
ncbi:MAG TPA: ParB/RepB/Spo0J family partition protein [Nitrososphaeraceae archaeon]|nr:ParB/RepB/Spo0J family partition protein [Nitrososphaeraceae archaeon]